MVITDDFTVSPLLRRARELTPLLAEHAADTERSGDLDPRCAAALAEAGMFSMFTPDSRTELGTAVDVLAALGRGCGASGWVAMILSTSGAMAMLFTDDVRSEIWGADPKAAVASVTNRTGTAERVPGGWRVSGRWLPASGIRHARWVLAGVAAEDDHGLVLVPVEEMRIIPTWSVSGLQGTASETVVAEDVFVPERRMLSMARALAGDYAAERPDEPIASVPMGAIMATMVVSPVLGMAEAALAHAIEQVRQRGPVLGTDYARAAESPAVQMNVATAASLVDSARLHVDRVVRDVAGAMRDRTGLDAAASARIRMDACVVSVNVRKAVGLLLDVSGSRTFATSNPLQRIWRDVEVACRHQLLVPDAGRERYGRVLLGVD